MGELVHEAFGIRYALHREVYLPSDDTFLLLQAVLANTPQRFLEVGTGIGMVAIGAAKAGARVVATDISADALATARANARRNGVLVDVVRAHTLAGLRPERFDLIAFNPPYLPTLKEERVPGPLNAAFDGGPDGLAVTRSFLNELPAAPPPTLLIASGLQPEGLLQRELASRGLQGMEVASIRLPLERLSVVRIEAARKP